MIKVGVPISAPTAEDFALNSRPVRCPCGAPSQHLAISLRHYSSNADMNGSHQHIGTGSGNIPTNRASWTPEENKAFEKALVDMPDETPDRWLRIASQIPSKSPEDIHLHYIALLHDIALIDSGGFDLPEYDEDEDDPIGRSPDQQPAKDGRRKGVPWTEDEHRRFLEGLERFGRGDWRNISRWAVKTRTPTQVASHAQKFYLRQNVKKESKRKSIHDITS
ncbi:hypothetical protein IEQ34_000252 [Dendrobium chrysotoxum]|uniref:Transcription factor MYBS1 n=1 Tax=Dendrobium chrysotoxum TaxID=161865 RepID=A0AAV7HQP8_DENCH|nr:hypothetical protein IEQ34_000252 [Dendrobium chrysotoxum]